MARLEPIALPASPELQQVFDQLTPPGTTTLSLFRTLARSPRVFERFRAGGLLSPGPLSLRQRELVILRVCALNGCEYEWGVHVAFFAGKAGITPQETAATVQGGGAWPEAEAALLGAAEQLDRTTRLDDDGWSRLRAHFDEAQVLELFALTGFYRTVSLHANALKLDPEPFAARFPAH